MTTSDSAMTLEEMQEAMTRILEAYKDALARAADREEQAQKTYSRWCRDMDEIAKISKMLDELLNKAGAW